MQFIIIIAYCELKAKIYATSLTYSSVYTVKISNFAFCIHQRNWRLSDLHACKHCVLMNRIDEHSLCFEQHTSIPGSSRVVDGENNN